MNRWIVLTCTLLLCIGAIIFLPKLFAFQTSLAQLKGNVSVFNPHSITTLSNDNLVDRLSSLPLTVPISRVEWSKSILTLDLKVVTSESTATEIYENMAEAISFCFEHTPNVDRLMLRLVAENKWLNSRHLLLAADVSRERWSSVLTEELKSNGETPLPDLLKQTFHMTETKLWQNQFQRP
ncbi:hypothetical protein ACP8HI_11880 [Paenibacillus sp. FA6]|uniref:hypothetical protein n=1 Tax=Paenibacillus sp. FA6 TaxID=3413029 RepID=UPI003F65E63F